jgi:hypothetical protein
VVSSILLCGSIVYSVFVVIIFVDLFRFLTSGIRALSLAGVVGKYFLFLQIFFSEKKKEGRDILANLKKKNRPKRSPEGQDIEVLKSVNFQGFFCGRRRDLFLFL